MTSILLFQAEVGWLVYLAGVLMVAVLIVIAGNWLASKELPAGSKGWEKAKHKKGECGDYPVNVSNKTGGAYGCQQCIIEDELERIKMGLK